MAEQVEKDCIFLQLLILKIKQHKTSDVCIVPKLMVSTICMQAFKKSHCLLTLKKTLFHE